jgi:hypothetical protein
LATVGAAAVVLTGCGEGDSTVDGSPASQACVKIASGEPARCGAPLTESKRLYASSSQRPPSKPEPPNPKPKPIITKRQACGSYGGFDANVCQDSYVALCVYGHLKRRVRAYYEGNAPDLSTQAVRWARGYYGRQESWEAGMTGCQAALLDEYQRLYSGG